MHTSKLLICSLLAGAAAAQETYWVPNRFSNDVHEVTAFGKVVRNVVLASPVRGVHQAPDGMLWVVHFSGPITRYDPIANTQSAVATSLGSAYELAFDAQGHAWVSGGTGVEEFDASGTSLQTYPLTASAPLGITVDASGNKWIAHRAGPPGSLSRIDAVTGQVSNHPLPASSLILPTKVYADYRGILQPSHVWVVGDNRGAAELVEFDSAGTWLNTYIIAAGSSVGLGSIAEDLAGNLYVGAFSSGTVYQIDRNTGVILQQFPNPPSTTGLACDGFGALWATTRLGNATTSPASEMHRLDSATGAIESLATVGIAASWAMSTRFQHALVVDQIGDLDGDGAANITELLAGDSYNDACSFNGLTVASRGVTATGNTARLDFGAATFVYAYSFGLLASGLPFPGFRCALQLDPVTMFVAGVVVGPGSVSLPIPANPALVGKELYTQAAGIGAGGSGFTNVSGVRIWM